MNFKSLCALVLAYALSGTCYAGGFVVLETDFGLKDGAVAEVKGVMYSVDKSLVITDLTHEIPVYNIWEAAYRLQQTASYWPQGTVFVSVVDPGVGTKENSIVAKSNSGHYFVTPDNGSLTLINDNDGIKEIREIDLNKFRLPGSTESNTFFGRDVYGYVAAKLASGQVRFEDLGPRLQDFSVKLSYKKPVLDEKGLQGTVAVLDPQYGNLWTNISKNLADQYNMKKGEKYRVKIFYKNQKRYESVMPFQTTFGEVPVGENLLYLNSLLNLAIAVNQENFAEKNKVASGPDWRIEIEKIAH